VLDLINWKKKKNLLQMGFNKRLVSKETIKEYIENNKPLYDLFKPDCIIFMDDLSSKVFNLHKEGFTDRDIQNKLNGAS
jgi:hypothetical protein